MNIEDLYNFMILYRTRNISDAATQLNITQSALSKRLKNMQDELQVQLFSTRNKRQLTMLDSGEVFFRYAQSIVTQYETMKGELQDYQKLQRGFLKVGCIPVVEQYSLAIKMRNFMNEFPKIDIAFSEFEGETLLEKLSTGKIDVVILRDIQGKQLNDSQFEFVDLTDDELFVVLDKNHPLAQKDVLRIQDLKEVDIVTLNPGSGVYELILNSYKKEKISTNVRFVSPHIESLLATILNTNEVTLLFSKSVKPFMTSDFVMRPLIPSVISHLQLVYPRGDASLLRKSFINYFTGVNMKM